MKNRIDRLMSWLMGILGSLELTVILITAIITITFIMYMRAIGEYANFINGFGYKYFH